MTKDAIEHRLTLVADMLQRAVTEITDVLSHLDGAVTEPSDVEGEEPPNDGKQDS